MMRRLTLSALAFLVAAAAHASKIETKQVLSDVYTIDKKYRSMEGPSGIQRVYLGDPETPELIWLTAIKTEVVDADGKTPRSSELMCHMNVDLDVMRHRALFGLRRHVGARLMTLSQGMLSSGLFEARLPKGFGFPIASNEPLIVYTQVLNHNIQKPKNLRVRHRVTFDYIRDRNATQPMKALFTVSASGMVVLDENPLALLPSLSGVSVDAKGHTASCLVLPRAPNAVGMNSDYVDPTGRKLTGHWIVPPGKQVNHSDVTWFMSLPYDTTFHYAAVHLHPFAKSLTMRDVTTGETLFEAKARNPKKGIGLAAVDTIVSEKGIRLYKDHKYELVSVYDNPLSENADSMASVFLGAVDPEFEKPDATKLAARAIEYISEAAETVAVFRTNAGDFGVELLRGSAPETVRQFVRLARTGAWNGTRLTAAQPGVADAEVGKLTELQRAMVKSIALESGVRHEAGTLSLCPGSTTLSIITAAAPSRDGRCTAFAHVGPGGGVIRQIGESANGSAIEIRRIDLYDSKDEAATVTLTPPQVVSNSSR